MASEAPLAIRSGPIAPGVAFITGGARGLGNAIAISFAKEGARGVVLVDVLDEETMNQGRKAVEAYGTKCITIRADVTKESEVEAAVQQAVKEFGRIDYAANFAGIAGTAQNVSDHDLDDWHKVMNINTTGVLLCTKHEMKVMKQQGPSPGNEPGFPIQQQGSIVNAASVNSLQSMPGTAAYTASKHAVHGIVKAAALEGRKHNVRVNAVSPGWILTKLVEHEVTEKGGRLEKLWPHFETRQGRVGYPQEAGDVVVLLSLPRMSLVTGQNLFIDGGFTINEAII